MDTGFNPEGPAPDNVNPEQGGRFLTGRPRLRLLQYESTPRISATGII